jgi:hypothetical protein
MPTTTESYQQTTTDSFETTTQLITETSTNSIDENTSTTPQQTTTDLPKEETTTNSEEETTTKGSSKPGNSSCPPLEEGQAHFVCPTSFRRHPKDCQMFYQCTQSPETSHLSIVTFNCPNGTVYDEDKIQCRDRVKDDNCPSSNNKTLLRGTPFEFTDEESPIVSFFFA